MLKSCASKPNSNHSATDTVNLSNSKVETKMLATACTSYVHVKRNMLSIKAVIVKGEHSVDRETASRGRLDWNGHV